MSYDYSEKLRNPKWQKKRLKIMERDGFKCIRCKKDDSTLHIHHLWYKGEPWEVEDMALETLCEDCHYWRGELDDFVNSFFGHKSTVGTPLLFWFLIYFRYFLTGEDGSVSANEYWSPQKLISRCQAYRDQKFGLPDDEKEDAEDVQEHAILQFTEALWRAGDPSCHGSPDWVIDFRKDRSLSDGMK